MVTQQVVLPAVIGKLKVAMKYNEESKRANSVCNMSGNRGCKPSPVGVYTSFKRL